MIEGIDYCFIYPKDDEKSVHVKLLDGPYKDTVFKYGKVKFEERHGDVHLLFAFDVIESPFMEADKLTEDTDFIHFAGDLLRDLMGGLQGTLLDETGTDDIEESGIQ